MGELTKEVFDAFLEESLKWETEGPVFVCPSERWIALMLQTQTRIAHNPKADPAERRAARAALKRWRSGERSPWVLTPEEAERFF
jgi:hypothetical protein